MKFLRAVILMSVVAAVGCGQNPHVTGSDPASAGASGADTSAQEVVTDPNAAATPAESDSDSDAIAADDSNAGNSDVAQDDSSTSSDSSSSEEQVTEQPVIVQIEETATQTESAPQPEPAPETITPIAMSDSNSSDSNSSDALIADTSSDSSNSSDTSSTSTDSTLIVDSGDGSDTSTSSSTETNTTIVVQQPAPEVQVIHGRNGVNGRPGRDGRDQCYAPGHPTSTEAFSPAELAALNADSTSLPYHFHIQGSAERPALGGVVTIGQGRIPTNPRNARQRLRTRDCTAGQANCRVENALVVFRTQALLPSRNRIARHEPIRAVLHLELQKRSAAAETFDDTELLCLKDEQICSGKQFLSLEEERARGMRVTSRSLDWSLLINRSFGESHGGPMLNDLFSGELRAANQTARAQRSSRGRRMVNAALPPLALDLARIFAPAGQTLDRDQLLDLLYRGLNESEGGIRTMNFVIGDDILVKSARLELIYTRYTCDGEQPSQSQEQEQTQFQTPSPAPAPAASSILNLPLSSLGSAQPAAQPAAAPQQAQPAQQPAPAPAAAPAAPATPAQPAQQQTVQQAADELTNLWNSFGF